jgi:uncharacterized protein (TIGR03067 family)
MTQALAIAVAIVLTSGVFAGQGKVPADLAPFQGTWTITSIDGTSAADAGMSGELVITGAKYAVKISGQPDEHGTFKVDRSKKPVTIDLLIEAGPGDSGGKAQLGIVEIGTNTLKFKMAQPGATTRPAGFEPAEGQNVIVVTKKK